MSDQFEQNRQQILRERTLDTLKRNLKRKSRAE